MPAPPSSTIESLALAALQGAGLKGEKIPPLAAAIGQTYGTALSLFLSQAMVMPGIPTAGNPVSQSGSTAGPGQLMPPPAGGPDAGQIEPLALQALSGQGLNGEKKGSLAKVMAQALAQGIQQFTSLRMVAPGIAIAGAVSTAPGLLMGAGPARGQLEGLVSAAMQGESLRGENARDLAGALADVVAQALDLFASMALVAPGIACPIPGASAAPGRLM
jgi:hypothetical protein